MSAEYEPFDLKIGKLTGSNWERIDMTVLSNQLMAKQGKPRSSVENRIIVLFDKSQSSSTHFLQTNRSLIVRALSNVAWRPYAFTHWVDKPNAWVSLVLIEQGNYHMETQYYEHSIGLGVREPDKAQFEFELLEEMTEITGGLIKHNPIRTEHGYDGDLLVDVAEICNPLTHPYLLSSIPVCDYSDKSVTWANCLPCPLFRDGHCLSRGASFHQMMSTEKTKDKS